MVIIGMKPHCGPSPFGCLVFVASATILAGPADPAAASPAAAAQPPAATTQAVSPADTNAVLHYEGRVYPLFPVQLSACPDLPSPLRLANGIEVVLTVTSNQQFTLVPVTVENGAPLNYARQQWGKGRQLDADTNGFPALAATGRHAETQLRSTQTINGLSMAELTKKGRPERVSSVGFLAPDEDIVSVLIGDNRLVEALGLTHRDLARPLFHLWNLLLARDDARRRVAEHRVRYHGRDVTVQWQSSKGWVESLFGDELQGMYQFVVWRELSADETALLDARYPHLKATEREELVQRLSRIHSGEMVPYLIQRYGFYEGHTDYRADPVAIAFIFGLRSLAEIERAFPGRLLAVLADHFTPQAPY